MKAKFIIKLLVLTLAIFSFAPNVYSAWTVDKTSINFGDVTVGTSKTVPVVITNTGTTDVTITGAFVSIPEVTFAIQDITGVFKKPPVTIAPGEIITVAITFSPVGTGTYNGEIVFTSNDPAQPSRTVTFAGKAILPTSGWTVNPTSIDFGDVPIGTSKIMPINITNTGNRTLYISKVNSSLKQVEVLWPLLGFYILPGQSGAITAIFTPDSRGYYSGEIVITSDDPVNPSIVVPFVGTSYAGTGIKVTPLSLDFGNVSIGTSAQRVFTVENTSATKTFQVTINAPASPFFMEKFDISIIDSATGIVYDWWEDFTFNFILKPKEKRNIIVRFTPYETVAYDGFLTVVSDDEENPMIMVSLKGSAGSEAPIAYSPSILYFGNVLKNSSMEKYIRIYNPGKEIVEINSITLKNINGDAFSISSAISFPLRLVPGEERKIYIKFSPKDIYQYSAVIEIKTGKSTYNISVIGIGSETQTTGLEPQNPPPSSGGGGGGCSISGTREASAFGNAILMFLPAIAIALRKLYRNLR